MSQDASWSASAGTVSGGDAPPLLELERVSRVYGEEVEVYALREVSLKIMAGDFMSIDGVAANHVARWRNGTWNAVGTSVSGGGFPGVTVVDALGQPPLAQCPTKVAGIGREDDITRSQSHLQRLVPRGMAMRRQADDAAVTEQIVLTIDLNHLVAEIEIGSVEPAQCGDIGIHSRFPLTLLNDHHGVGNERVPADMVEMEMRVDDDVDPPRIAVDRL